MRKVLSAILVIVLCLGLCACGPSEEAVKSAIIQKGWYGSNKNQDGAWEEYSINFSYNSTAAVSRTTGHSSYGIFSKDSWKCTYTIKNDKIIISDSGRDFIINYAFVNNEIKLTLVLATGVEVPLRVRTGS